MPFQAQKVMRHVLQQHVRWTAIEHQYPDFFHSFLKKLRALCSRLTASQPPNSQSDVIRFLQHVLSKSHGMWASTKVQLLALSWLSEALEMHSNAPEPEVCGCDAGRGCR